MDAKKIICINCPRGCQVTVESRQKQISSITGHLCPRGEKYAREEFLNPTRVLPTTVRVLNGESPLVPVKTSEPIPKKLLLPAMKVIGRLWVEAPVRISQVLISNFMDTGIDLIATGTVKRNLD